MTYSAIMSELADEIIDEVLIKSTGAAYSADFTAQHADCAAWMGDCAIDPDA